ncbi:MAG: TolC family protein [Acidobacteriota bacterium]
MNFYRYIRFTQMLAVAALFTPHLAGMPAQEITPAEPVLTLEDLERMALRNNPTIAQAEAAVRAAEGLKLQAGLYPNPILGYMGEELSARAPSETSEHLMFVEQRIVTAGKLSKSRSIFAQVQAQAEAEAEAQKLRVLNAVRVVYYAALGAQRLVEVRAELAGIAGEAVDISEQLFNVGAADRPDILEVEIEAQRAELDLIRAQNSLEQVWLVLAAVVGVPSLPPARLEGSLEENIPRFDRETILSQLLLESPEVKQAQAGVERAQAVLDRAKAEPVPDILLRGGFGYNFEELDALGGSVGPEGFIEVGIQIPLFDRNQGNVAAARAEVIRAQRELQRRRLALRARLAAAYTSYLNSLRIVERYQVDVLPRAQQAYELYRTRFQEMAAAYPQVLIAQRTFFQVQGEYVDALVDLRQQAVQIQGLLLTGGLDAPGDPTPEVGLEAGNTQKFLQEEIH